MQYVEFGGKDVAWGIKWEPGNPDSAYYVCKNAVDCGCVIEEHHKAWMLENAKWVAMNPAAGPRRRSFKKTAWASNLVAWRKLVSEWLEIQAEKLVTQLQQFINTVNCELWDPLNGKEVNTEGLITRLGVGYPADGTLPPEIGLLTAAVDTQDDRLEYAVWGWGAFEESWLVRWYLIEGDPATQKPWRELDRLRAIPYAFANGFALRPSMTFIDSGGHHSTEVYGYCRTRAAQNVYAIKGSSLQGAPLVGEKMRNNKANTILIQVGSFTGKDTAANRLARIAEPGPGYIHLPENLDAEQVAQFTRSRLVTPTNRGGRSWTKPKSFWEEKGRVEQFHLYVYAMMALHSLGRKHVNALGSYAQQHQRRVVETVGASNASAKGIVSSGIDW